MITKKPWGYEELIALTEKYAMKKMVINPEQRMSLQYHNKKEETVYVVSGVLRVWNELGSVIDLKPESTYHVKPGQVHRFGADKESVVLIECSSTELHDVVRIEDDYNR